MLEPIYREPPGPAEIHRLMQLARPERSRVLGDALVALLRRVRRRRWWPLASEVLPAAPRRG
jgi:hypothetical protein